MSSWDSYPSDYREREVQTIVAALRAGECVSVIGLSGAGKSNLLGFVAHRRSTPQHPVVMVDCNRVAEPTPAALFRTIRQSVESSPGEAVDEFAALESALAKRLSAPGTSLNLALDLSLLFSRFDQLAHDQALAGNLRALRDTHRYRLTYVIATRRPLPSHTELAELFYAHTLWLGPLGESDARWNVTRYARRRGLTWDEATTQTLINISQGYPSLLRAACEAHADGARLDPQGLAAHPAVQARVEEFWADRPTDEELRQSGLETHPLVMAGRAPSFDSLNLTAKENLLLNYFRAHPDAVCDKDDLIRAVWPEDKVFERGVRDDSLAQLVRRLREKIEPDASNPRYIHTAPGRGYRFAKG